jgi:hypothetical protein|tara:strand:+ start:6240 stop:6506 length:267 start_codon:yes stop_codon:yes gene_type:complete
VVNVVLVELHFTGIKRELRMVKWLEPIGKHKQHLRCDACKQYLFSVFFLWYSHPSIAHLSKGDPLTVCTKCCKREAGNEYYNKKMEEL